MPTVTIPLPAIRSPSFPALRMPTATTPAHPDARINYYEWCQDHNKPLETAPFGDVAGGGPVTLPDPEHLANGAWYGGSPYLGPDATGRAQSAPPARTPPSGTVANSPTDEAGFAFMWHSHNEREITTNNIFPGRNDDDDAGRFPGICDRRVQLTEEKSNAIQQSQTL